MTEQIAQQAPKKRGLLRRAFDHIKGKTPERVETMWTRLHKEAAFIPVLNATDTETRRREIQAVLSLLESEGKMGAIDDKTRMEVVDTTYALFFTTGSPWYRGLGNRELAKKVAMFLWLYNDVRDCPAFLRDLFMCSMQLLNLSWQALDVTNTPWYIIEKNPAPSIGERIDLSGSDVSRTRKEEV